MDGSELVVRLEYRDATRALDSLDAALVDVDECVEEMFAARAARRAMREEAAREGEQEAAA